MTDQALTKRDKKVFAIYPVPGAVARPAATLAFVALVVGAALWTAPLRWFVVAAIALGVAAFVSVGLGGSTLLRGGPQVVVTSEGLELTGVMPKYDFPALHQSASWSDLLLDQASVVDLYKRRDLRPSLRLYGAAGFGFLSGVVALKNGQEATTLLTDRRQVACIPMRDGSMFLLSVAARQKQRHDLARLNRRLSCTNRVLPHRSFRTVA